MSGSVQDQVEALTRLNLDDLRRVWRTHWGEPPKLRSPDLLRLLIAWRLQAVAYGGLDAATRRLLVRTGPTRAEGLHLGNGAVLRRTWQGRTVEVTVSDSGFLWQGKRYRSLSAVATAIAGTRWNGPRFFGMRETAS